MNSADYPSFRLVIPLIGGILISDTLESTTFMVWLCCVVFFTSVVYTVLLYISGDRRSISFGVSLSLTFFSLGASLSMIDMTEVKVEWDEKKQLHQAVLTDYPLEKKSSFRLDLMLQDSDYRGKNIIMYVPKDSNAAVCVPGETIRFYGSIKKPSNETTEVDFDYASYLYRHSISGTLWVNSKNWWKTGVHQLRSIRIQALRLRKRMFDKYMIWGFRDDVLAVVSAVSLGYKKEISDELRQTYSSSGASHVLAVSGLHVGIMCSFLSIMFSAFMNVRHRRWIKEITVITVMWTYSFLIGLPLSITRSMIMFSLMAVCRSIGRESSSMNCLATAALIILLFQPSGVYDISFQLSFLAVFFILLLEPIVANIIQTRTLVGEYFCNIMALSIAAQIGTLPIVLYNFSSFSTYFLVTNLLVIPLFFVIVSLCAILWLVAWLPILRMAVVKVLSLIVEFVNNSLDDIVGLPHSNVSIHINRPETVLLVYLVIIMLYAYLSEKKTHRLVQVLGCISIWSLYMLSESVLKLFAV